MRGKMETVHKARGILRAAQSSEFLRHNAIFFAGSMAIGALNYLYYPILGRMLAPAAFGEVQTIVTLFLQLAVFLGVIGNLTVNIVANHPGEKAAQRTMMELERLALIVSVICLAVTAIIAPQLRNFFQFKDTLPFIVLAVAMVISVPATFRSAYLRGSKAFGAASVAGLISAAAKLLLSVLFVKLGWGVSGAIFGLVIAQALSYLYAAMQAQRSGYKTPSGASWFTLPNIKLIQPELKYAGLVLVCSLTTTMLYSVDVIAVKHYFDAHTAGLYAGLATVARIMFFLTGSIAQVLLPSVKLKQPSSANRAVLAKSAVLTSMVGGGVLLMFWIMPSRVVNLLMGEGYEPYAHLLPRLSLVIFTVSLLNLVMLYFMALRRYAIGFLGILGITVTCGLVGMYHDSPQAIIDSMLYGVTGLGVSIMVWLLLTRRPAKTEGGGT